MDKTAFVKTVMATFLGKEEQERPYVLRSLMYAFVYFFCLLLQGYNIWAGFVQWEQAKWLCCVIVFNMFFWFGLMRSGQTLRFKDPFITIPQTLSLIGCIAWAYGVFGPVHAATMMLLGLVMMVGFFNIKPSQARLISLSTIVIMGGVIAYKMVDEPNFYLARIEFVYFVMMVVMVSAISFITSQLYQMRERLQEQQKELHVAFDKIMVLATNDELTGLINRRHMLQMVAQHQQNMSRMGRYRYCLAIIDLDHFKRINDTYGHGIGDKVLTNFAKAVVSIMRETDILSRWGGEEFLLLLKDSDIAQAQTGIERIRKHIANVPMVPEIPELLVTFSAGVSAFTADESIHSCIERADRALYEAKESGRNSTRAFMQPPINSLPPSAHHTAHETSSHHAL